MLKDLELKPSSSVGFGGDQKGKIIGSGTIFRTFIMCFIFPQLCKHVLDPSHVTQMDDVKVRDNLTVETSPLWIDEQEVKYLRGK